jgi:hypothetical protein
MHMHTTPSAPSYHKNSHSFKLQIAALWHFLSTALEIEQKYT